jgi:hypothetical protein
MLTFDENRVKRRVLVFPKFFLWQLLSLKIEVKQETGGRLSAVGLAPLATRTAADWQALFTPPVVNRGVNGGA